MAPFRQESYNYAIWGAVFGLCFPVLASLLEAYTSYNEISLQTIIAVQSTSRLLWIIDTAPFFLGLFSFFIGKQIDTVKLKNDQILRAQEQLILQEQMATIGQMTAGIAHEIKNPLNFVTNFSESSIEMLEDLSNLLHEYENNFSRTDLVEINDLINDLIQNGRDVNENGKRANRIVHSMMDHTRSNSGDRKLMDINRLLEENVNLAFQGYRANHPSFNLHLNRNYDEQLSAVEVNAQSLGRVFLNILNNSFHALDKKMSEDQNGFIPSVDIFTSKIGQEVEIRIRDNGDGIPPELRHRIFEPFFTTKPSGHGNSGLGLSISLDIIAQEHQGSLIIDSEVGQYTEFIISIPASNN